MVRYIIKRLLWMIPILLGVLLIVFTISYFTPGDPVLSMLGTNYTEELYQQTSEALGLDKPFLVQYANYVWNVFTKFDFGTSYSYKTAVGADMLYRLPTSLKLAIWGTVLSVVIGIPFGLISATRQYSVLDYGVTIFAIFFASVPNFWLGLMLLLLFSVKLGWFPAAGIQAWYSWVLPVVTQGLMSVALITRMTRSSMLDVIRQDYIRTARAKGLKENTIIMRHALKAALIPVITIVGMQIGVQLGGSVIVETIFTIPGLGNYMMAGINGRDYPIINGTVLLFSFGICIMNLIVDIVYAYLDPRIKAQYVSHKAVQKKLNKKIMTEEAADKQEAEA